VVKKPRKRSQKPKFYPILPGRRKAQRLEKQDGLTTPISYSRRLYADLTLISTGDVSEFLNESNERTLAWNSKSFARHPGWQLAVAKGGDATFSYSREIGTYKPIVYGGTSKNATWRSKCYGSIHGVGPVFEPKETLTLQDQALGKLKHKLNGYIGNAQLQAPLAESREIHRIVRQINTIGIDTLKALLAIKKTRGKSAAKHFGDVWLGFGFGINPMLKDIEKAANSILDYNTRQDRTVRVVGTATREYHSRVANTVGESVAFGTTCKTISQVIHTQGVQIVAGIDLQTRSAASYSVYDHLGLEISEIPSTLWELTPYSWAFDYFFTVSPWLDDMFYTLPGECKYVSQATKYQSETTDYPVFVPQSGFTWSGGGTMGRARYVSFSRTPLAVLPSRGIRIKTSDEIAKYGGTKLLNLASVLAGRMGPKLHPRTGLPFQISHAGF
jgi:hypothetical protein